MHVHIQKSKRNQARISTSPLFVKLTENGSTATYFYHVRNMLLSNEKTIPHLIFQEWTMLGNQILEVTSTIYAAEKEAFDAIRNDVSQLGNDVVYR